MAVGAASCLKGALHGGAHGEHFAALVLGTVDKFAAWGVNKHLFRVHLVLGEVLHIGVAEVAKSTVQGDECAVDVVYLHALEHLA